MQDVPYERKGIGEDRLTHQWFCEVLRNAKQQLAAKQVEEAEMTVAFASLFALERMSTQALAASLSVLAEILESKGEKIQDYLSPHGDSKAA